MHLTGGYEEFDVDFVTNFTGYCEKRAFATGVWDVG